jgi:hypothetical protein
VVVCLLGEPDIVVADDVLGFAGIEPPSPRLYPIETHIAEKLHAYGIRRVEAFDLGLELEDEGGTPHCLRTTRSTTPA